MTSGLLQVLALASLFTCSAAFRINAKVDDEVTKEDMQHVGLCDAQIVKDTCKALDIDNSDTDTITKVAEVSHAMWATRESTMAFLKFIGIDAGNALTGFHLDDGEEINCLELCEKTLASLDEHWLPPYSDVGCHSAHVNATGDDTAICDIDLSPESMQNVRFSEEAKDFHAGHPVLGSKNREPAPGPAPAHHSKNDSGLHITGHAVRLEARVQVSIGDAQIKIANLFRVYPMVSIDTDFPVSDMEEAEEAGANVSLLEVSAKPYPYLTISGGCQDDVKGTWKHTGTTLSGSPIYRRRTPSGDRFLYHDSNCGWHAQPKWIISKGGSRWKPSQSKRSDLDGDGKCDYTGRLNSKSVRSIPLGTQTWKMECGARGTQQVRLKIAERSASAIKRPEPPSIRPSPKPQEPWITEVEKVSVKAQAYVATAIRKSGSDSRILREWMGGNSGDVRAKLSKILNSLSVMLSHVVYKKGPECSSNTYAYVYPHGSKAKEGNNFVFYLCDVYFKSGEGEKIETLTHEGSHHSFGYTDDVCDGPIRNEGTRNEECKGKTAYGRPTCKRLAQRYPERAQVNADSYCYYINDINTRR